MAIRDPYFWKRFSAAVHASEAEEAAAAAAASASSTADTESGGDVEKNADGDGKKSKSGRKSVLAGRGRRAKVERTPSWLERQQAKKARRTLICWLFWFLFAGLIGAVVAVLLVLRSRGFIK